MPWVDYRELRHLLKTEDVLSWMQWRATERRGETLMGNCPFCGTAESGQGREFVVHRVRKLYHCFRCKQGGNILELWSRYNKIDLNSAANELSKHLCAPPTSNSSNSQLHSRQPPISQSTNQPNRKSGSVSDRKRHGGAAQSASGTHNRLQTDGTYNYAYDAEGNTTKRTSISTAAVTEYTWDHRNRLTSVTERVSATGATTQKVEFIYDAFDQRVGKRVDTDGDTD